MEYVIIGNGVAGMNAANQIRRRHGDARVTIVSYESDHFFSRTALMYVFSGQLSERCVEPYDRDYYDRMRFTRARDRVKAVIADKNLLQLELGGELPYDKLLIASGSLAVPPPWPGGDLEGVERFVTWQDLQRMREKARTARRAVIIGGGLIGIEVAEVLLQAGIAVTFLVREEHYWPVALDREESGIIVPHMQHHKCDVRLATETEEIVGRDGRVTGVRTGSGEIIDCDLAVVTIGVAPQTEFLKASGIELDQRGGIVVNDFLESSLPDIWAAGDCTSVVWFNGVRRPEQLWYTSRDQGRVAGLNMAGDRRVYRRTTFYNSAKFFDIEYTTAGLVNFNIAGEENLFRREGDSERSQRIVTLADGTVIGFNMLGRRWDHTILVRWIEEKRQVSWVTKHLGEALFDEEFMPRFPPLAVTA